ncbi:MAG: hypothetical protein L0H83_01405, partial [Salinisphaera sp.]|nr:hypothetical protein [Salinisphaera sp.]
MAANPEQIGLSDLGLKPGKATKGRPPVTTLDSLGYKPKSVTTLESMGYKTPPAKPEKKDFDWTSVQGARAGLGLTSEAFAKSVYSAPPKLLAHLSAGLYNAIPYVEDVDVRTLPLYRLGEYLGDIAEVPDIPQQARESLPGKVATGLGQFGGMAATGAFGAGRKAVQFGLSALMGGQMTGEAGAKDYRRTMEQRGEPAVPSKAAAAYWLNFGIGTSEAIPVFNALHRIGVPAPIVEKAITKVVGAGAGKLITRLASRAGRAGVGAVEEGGQEAVSQGLTNLVASDVLAYDPQRGAYEGTATSGAVGAVVGAIINAALPGKLPSIQQPDSQTLAIVDKAMRNEPLTEAENKTLEKAGLAKRKKGILKRTRRMNALVSALEKARQNIGTADAAAGATQPSTQQEVTTNGNVRQGLQDGPQERNGQRQGAQLHRDEAPGQQAGATRDVQPGGRPVQRGRDQDDGSRDQQPLIPRAAFYADPDNAGLDHRELVQQAISGGAPVPPEVLLDYPDLLEQPNAKESKQTPQEENQQAEQEAQGVLNAETVRGDTRQAQAQGRVNQESENTSGEDLQQQEGQKASQRQTQDVTPDLRLQNRDRSRPESQIQMASIANDPDFDRLGASPTPDFGAPMVSVAGDDDVIGNHGRDQTVVFADGTKVKTRYAVAEADSVMASNDAQGRVNQAYYQDPKSGDIRALNNGRTAGLQSAYARGNAEKYRQALVDNAKDLGIDPDAVRSMEKPMLVRVYDESENARQDIAQASNVSQGLGLSVPEQAQNDARFLNMASYDPESDILSQDNRAFVTDFIKNVPDNDRANLTTSDGRPTKQLRDRIQAALIARGHRDPGILSLAAEADDSPLRNVLNAMVSASGEFAKVGDNPPLDIRDKLVGAAKFLQDARQRGMSIDDAMRQQDIFGRDADVSAIAQWMAVNIRSSRRMAAGMSEMARFMQREEQAAGNGDMFGRETATIQDLYAAVNNYLEAEYGDKSRPIETGVAAGQGDAAPGDQSGQQGERSRAEAGQPVGAVQQRLEERGAPSNGGAQTDAIRNAVMAMPVEEVRQRAKALFRDQGVNKPTGIAKSALAAIVSDPDQVDPEAAAAAFGIESPGAFNLRTQTSEDLAQREQAQQQAEDEQAEQRRQAEQKAQADREDFVLTGSDSPIDQAEARGQRSLFEPSGAYIGGDENVRNSRNLPPEAERGDAAGTQVSGDVQSTGAIRAEEPAGPVQLELFIPAQSPIAQEAAQFATQTTSVQVGKLPVGTNVIKNESDVAHVVSALRKSPQEKMYAVVTDDQGRVLTVIQHSIGTTNSATVSVGLLAGHVRDVPQAANVWFAHNHPSGLSGQSRADLDITQALNNILEGSGIQAHGMVVVAPSGEPSFQADGRHTSQPIKQTPRARRQSVPVSEPRFKRIGTLQQDTINSSNEMIAFVRDRPDGVYLFDNRPRPVGVLPMTAEQMKRLRTGDKNQGSGQLLHAIAQTNASAVMTRVPDKASVKAAHNVQRFINAAGLRYLDTIYADESGAMTSAMERSIDRGPTDNAFMSRSGQAGTPGRKYRDAFVASKDGRMVYPNLALQAAQGRPVELTAVKPRLDRRGQEARRLHKFVKDTFGRDIVWFRSDDPAAPQGITFPRNNKNIYINVDSNFSLSRIAGHELVHSLRTGNPQAYEALSRAVHLLSNGYSEYGRRIRDTYAKDGLPDPGNAVVNEEFVADIVGAMWQEPGFMRELAAATDPSTFKRIVNAILAWLDNIQAKIKGHKPGVFLEKHTDNAAAVRRAVLSGIADMAKAGEIQTIATDHPLVQRMVAWHGSPHDFERFSMHAIGTGEGTQAYGWGLYLSSAKEVGEYYQEALARDLLELPNGKTMRLDPDGLITDARPLLEAMGRLGRIFPGDAQEFLDAHGTPQLLIQAINGSGGSDVLDGAQRWLQRKRSEAALFPNNQESVAAVDETIHALEAMRERGMNVGQGRLYQANIAPDESEFLDWGAPLGGQSDGVRRILSGLYHNPPEGVDRFRWMMGMMNATHYGSSEQDHAGGAIYLHIVDMLGGQQQASEYLNSIGIPGVKYEAGQLSDSAQGDTNYVLFDDSLLSIEAKFSRGNAPMSREPNESARDINQALANALNQVRKHVPVNISTVNPADIYGAGAVEGVYENGEVTLFAGNISSPKRAAEVLRHEAVGHFSLERMLGDSFLSRVASAGGLG